MESTWTPPTSSTNWPSRRGVIRVARGLARCWRSRKRVVTARSGTAGRDMSTESTIAAANRWLASRLCATLGSHGRPRSCPAMARRGARRVRLHLRCGRGDAMDGPRSERARRPLARTLRPRGGGAAHPRPPREGRGARLLLHPRMDGRALPGRRARYRGGRTRDRLPWRRARARLRSRSEAGGGDPHPEPRGADAAGRPTPRRLARACLAALAELTRPGGQARLRVHLEHDGPARAVPATGRARPAPRGDPRLVGAGRCALLHVHRPAEHPGPRPCAAILAHGVRRHHRGPRRHQLHLPSADHRAAVTAGLPARAPRLREAHPAPVDCAALRHRRALAADRPGLRLPATRIAHEHTGRETDGVRPDRTWGTRE